MNLHMCMAVTLLALGLGACAADAEPAKEDVSPDLTAGIEHSSGTVTPNVTSLYSKTLGYCTCFSRAWYCDPTPWNATNGDEKFQGRCLNEKTCC